MISSKLLQTLPPELAHDLAIGALRRGLGPRARWRAPASLTCRVFDRELPHPLALAAGFDKDAEAVLPLLQLGFSSVEVGGITPQAQPGNPKPRLWRLPEQQALINAMGFNNSGLASAQRRLAQLPASAVFAVNIGVNKHSSDPSADIKKTLDAFAASAHYLCLNLSSPNTAGLRSWLEPSNLNALLAELQPLPPNTVLKLSPDQSDEQVADVLSLAIEHQLAGLVVCNTRSVPVPGNEQRQGGLSGKPLRARALELLQQSSKLSQGRLQLVAVGGISDADSAWQRIVNGASLLQIYTAFIYQGAPVIEQICLGLAQRLRAHGYASIKEAIGSSTP